MRTILALFIGLQINPLRAAEPDYKAMKAEWGKFVVEHGKSDLKFRQEEAKEKIEALQAEKISVKAQTKKLLDIVGKKRQQIDTDKVEAARLKTMVEAKAKSIPDLEKVFKEEPQTTGYGIDPRDLKEGSFGLLGNGYQTAFPPQFKIIQIQDGSNLIATWGKKVYWIEVPTEGMVDKDDLVVTDYVHCLGTKSYQSVAGKSTVLHLKIVK